MKRVVLVLTLFLFTLSNAFHPESLDLTTRILNHYHQDDHQQLQIKPSSDGSDSSNILPPLSSTVPDPTQSHDVEFKEAVSEPEDVLEESNPVQIKNRVSYQVYRIKPIRYRKFIRFMRHPRRFGGINELRFDPVLNYVIRNRDGARKFPEVERAIRMFGQDWKDMGPLHHHHHHHHDHEDDDDDDDDDHWVEMKDDHHEDEHEDHHEKRKVKDVLKKKHKHDHDHDDEHEDHKKRKVKDMLKKKRKDKDDDDDDGIHDKVKGVIKKIRKFMNFF